MMRKILLGCFLLMSVQSHAQFPITQIIQAGIKKIIVAIDLKIQKLQNKTLILQNAQEVMENNMSKMSLSDIRGWVNKQKELYAEYFGELKKVKQAITYYHKVKDLIKDQAALVKEYKAAWNSFRLDKNFTTEELRFMEGVYTGILSESLMNLDQLFLVINSYTTQMSDAKRIGIIDAVAANMEQTLLDLRTFNNQNKSMSLQRSYEKGEIEYIRKLYGIK